MILTEDYTSTGAIARGQEILHFQVADAETGQGEIIPGRVFRGG